MLFPSPLTLGDAIGLIAPSSPVQPERLKPCMEILSSFGYQPVLGKSVTENLNGYLSGDDVTRACDINQMFSDSQIKAIFCLRGGYGATRIMDLLDYPMIAKNPKIFLGYSDITCLHLAFYSLCNLVTFHGPMVSSNMADGFDSFSKASLERALQMPPLLVFHNPKGYCYQPIVPGIAKGKLIGGCLSLVSSSMGTFYQPDFTNCILFLEEIEETVPRCERMMCHLKNAGVLNQVNGIILGNFKNCINPKNCNYTILDFFCDFFKDYDKPVLWGLQSGHDKPMGTIPFGEQCTMNTYTSRVVFERMPKTV